MASICTVDLGLRSYPIDIGAGLLSAIGPRCLDEGLAGRALIVIDEGVAELYGPTLRQSLGAAGIHAAEVIIPAGEQSKSHAQLIRIYDVALEAGLERSSFLLALGGGVIGDLTGYAAATYLRGVPFVQVPTTLLAMVDSAVGGKTGINMPQGKNLIGAFHQPSLVIADTPCLRSLPLREFSAGLAEVVKYGMIADPALWDVLEQSTLENVQADDDLLETIVLRSCEIKADVVQRDEREGGLRAILNFGHTLGHAVEQVTGYGEWLHGEAISLGMIYAARLSEELQGFSATETERLIQLLDHLKLPTTFPALSWDGLMKAMKLDKKRKSGTIGFVLAKHPGEVVFGCPVPDEVLAAVWDRCAS